jgi:Mg2+ and Co2+ transporter CorA
LFNPDESKRAEKKLELVLSQVFSGLDESSPTRIAMERKPAATNYIRNCHKKLWTRSQFSTRSKVDYVTNNLAECFNNWIKQHKSMNLDDLMDKIRQMLMSKWNQRRKISKKFHSLILPHLIKDLNEKSRELNWKWKNVQKMLLK